MYLYKFKVMMLFCKIRLLLTKVQMSWINITCRERYAHDKYHIHTTSFVSQLIYKAILS